MNGADIILLNTGQGLAMWNASLIARSCGVGAGAQDHFLSAGISDAVRRHFCLQFHPDLEFFKLGLVPGNQGSDLSAFGLTGCEPELATDFAQFLHQTNPVSAQRRYAGGFQPGRASADDQNVFWRFARGESITAPCNLTPNRRIDQTGDGIVIHTTPDTELVTGYTGPDILGAAFARLIRQMWIGDLSAHQTDHICVAQRQDIFSIFYGFDSGFGGDQGSVV